MASGELHLPFLYQTRTILRSSRCFATSSPQRLRRRPGVDPPSSFRATLTEEPRDFFVQKATELNLLSEKPAERSTITGVEKKAFNKIFKDITKANARTVRKEVPRKVDTDHEDILAIFSNSFKDYHTELQKKKEAQVRSGHQGEGTRSDARHAGDYSRYPEALRTAARRAANASSKSPSNHKSSAPSPTPVTASQDINARDEYNFTFKPVSASQVVDDNDLEHPAGASSAFMRPSFLDELLDLKNSQLSINEGYIRPNFARAVQHSDSTSEINPADVYDEVVDHVAKREMDKIARSFKATMSEQTNGVDRALWDVCQRRIFPMLQNLDPKAVDSPQSAKQQEPDSSSSRSSNPSPSKETESVWRWERLPSYIPPLSIISRLYPAALLLALRLFAKHSPTSPFPLAILPQVRAQGPKSYVLGGTTPFYNTLIKLQWDVYSDLREIDNLLVEMEKSGIELDVETYQILVGIGEERWADTSRAEEENVPRGARSKGWWERSEQTRWFQKVCIEWKQVIAGRLQEQGQGQLVSEREYQSESRGRALGFAQDEIPVGQRPVLIG